MLSIVETIPLTLIDLIKSSSVYQKPTHLSSAWIIPKLSCDLPNVEWIIWGIACSKSLTSGSPFPQQISLSASDWVMLWAFLSLLRFALLVLAIGLMEILNTVQGALFWGWNTCGYCQTLFLFLTFFAADTRTHVINKVYDVCRVELSISKSLANIVRFLTRQCHGCHTALRILIYLNIKGN